jgi:phosphoribosylformimino-5-aminoimidazole carboxamide ribotide isomerase
VIVVPAVDVRAGRVVRLRQGRPEEETVYGTSLVDVARRWEDEGAERLHLVDLDGALEGRPQWEALIAVIKALAIPVEVGGGLRSLESARRYRDAGADRLIFGTGAVTDGKLVRKAAALWPDSVAVAIDARDGRVVVAGWQEGTGVRALDLAAEVKAWGVRRIQYTDVTRDGTLAGPNLPGIEALATECGLRVTASGGVASLDDLRRLRALEPLGVDEVIVGKAFYEKRFTLGEAREAVA